MILNEDIIKEFRNFNLIINNDEDNYANSHYSQIIFRLIDNKDTKSYHQVVVNLLYTGSSYKYNRKLPVFDYISANIIRHDVENNQYVASNAIFIQNGSYIDLLNRIKKEIPTAEYINDFQYINLNTKFKRNDSLDTILLQEYTSMKDADILAKMYIAYDNGIDCATSKEYIDGYLGLKFLLLTTKNISIDRDPKDIFFKLDDFADNSRYEDFIKDPSNICYGLARLLFDNYKPYIEKNYSFISSKYLDGYVFEDEYPGLTKDLIEDELIIFDNMNFNDYSSIYDYFLSLVKELGYNYQDELDSLNSTNLTIDSISDKLIKLIHSDNDIDLFKMPMDRDTALLIMMTLYFLNEIHNQTDNSTIQYLFVDEEKNHPIAILVKHNEYQSNDYQLFAYDVTHHILQNYSSIEDYNDFITILGDVSERSCDGIAYIFNTKEAFSNESFQMIFNQPNVPFNKLISSKFFKQLPINENTLFSSVITEAAKNSRALRNKIESLIIGFMKKVDKTGANAEQYELKYSKMSDDKFFAHMRSFIKNKDENFYMEFLPGKGYPKLNDIIDGLNFLKVPKDEYVYYRHDGDEDNPLRTRYRVPVGYVNIRRVQQIISKKNSYSDDISHRNQKTGELTGESLAARVSDMESIALTAVGADAILREFLGPRGDAMDAKNEMYNEIASDGQVYLSKLDNDIKAKKALQTTSYDLFGAGLANDLLDSPADKLDISKYIDK